jgi:hypothetical protein
VCDSPDIIVTSHKQLRHLQNCTALVGNLKLSVKLRGVYMLYHHETALLMNDITLHHPSIATLTLYLHVLW